MVDYRDNLKSLAKKLEISEPVFEHKVIITTKPNIYTNSTLKINNQIFTLDEDIYTEDKNEFEIELAEKAYDLLMKFHDYVGFLYVKFKNNDIPIQKYNISYISYTTNTSTRSYRGNTEYNGKKYEIKGRHHQTDFDAKNDLAEQIWNDIKNTTNVNIREQYDIYQNKVNEKN